MEDALSRATALAVEVLAPDAVVEFSSLDLRPRPKITFRATSKLASRSGLLYVTEDQVEGDEDLRKPAPPSSWTEAPPEEGGEAIEPLVLDPVPWRSDTSWRVLVEKVWYRLRPTTEPVSLSYYPRFDKEAPVWSVFVVCVQYGSAPDGYGNSYCYGLKNGELRSFEFVHG